MFAKSSATCLMLFFYMLNSTLEPPSQANQVNPSQQVASALPGDEEIKAESLTLELTKNGQLLPVGVGPDEIRGRLVKLNVDLRVPIGLFSATSVQIEKWGAIKVVWIPKTKSY